MKEQRGDPRFAITTRCRLMGTITGECHGVTENVSRRGLLVQVTDTGPMAVLPGIGELLTVDIELPANVMYGQKLLRCRGTVVRVSNAAKALPRIALSIDQMEFSTGAGVPGRVEPARSLDGLLAMKGGRNARKQ